MGLISQIGIFLIAGLGAWCVYKTGHVLLSALPITFAGIVIMATNEICQAIKRK